MGEDLYSTGQATTPTANSGSAFDFGGFDIVEFLGNVEQVAYWANIIAFSWTLFYSIVLLWEFWFFRVSAPDGELVKREARGVKAINKAVRMWWFFLIIAFFHFGYLLLDNGAIKSIAGWVIVGSYIIKIFVADLPDIPHLGKVLGGPSQALSKNSSGFFESLKKGLIAVVDGIVSAFQG